MECLSNLKVSGIEHAINTLVKIGWDELLLACKGKDYRIIRNTQL